MAKAPSKQKTITFPKRGEIYLVDFDPTLGAEIRKTRPALVIQNDISNRYSPITVVAAITSKFDAPPYPTDVIIDPKETGLPVQSAVVLNQIRSIDKQRLVKRIGKVTEDTMQKAEQALKISLGLTSLEVE